MIGLVISSKEFLLIVLLWSLAAGLIYLGYSVGKKHGHREGWLDAMHNLHVEILGFTEMEDDTNEND